MTERAREKFTDGDQSYSKVYDLTYKTLPKEYKNGRCVSSEMMSCCQIWECIAAMMTLVRFIRAEMSNAKFGGRVSLQ
jgi:hypothetical protein